LNVLIASLCAGLSWGACKASWRCFLGDRADDRCSQFDSVSDFDHFAAKPNRVGRQCRHAGGDNAGGSLRSAVVAASIEEFTGLLVKSGALKAASIQKEHRE
jgi:hypothetical protein